MPAYNVSRYSPHTLKVMLNSSGPGPEIRYFHMSGPVTCSCGVCSGHPLRPECAESYEEHLRSRHAPKYATWNRFCYAQSLLLPSCGSEVCIYTEVLYMESCVNTHTHRVTSGPVSCSCGVCSAHPLRPECAEYYEEHLISRLTPKCVTWNRFSYALGFQLIF